MDMIAPMLPRSIVVLVTVSAALLGPVAAGQAPRRQRLNNVIDLLEQKKPVFGVYAPSNATGRGRAGAPPAVPAAVKAPMELAKEALAYHAADFLFNGSME